MTDRSDMIPARDVQAMIALAVAEEREACALAAERFGKGGTYKARIQRADRSDAKTVKAHDAIAHGEWIADCVAREIRARGDTQ